METIQVDASLVNPEDTTEVNVVAAVAAVGTTHRLSTGQRINWSAEFLRAHAKDFIGTPVNIRLKTDPTGKVKASDHSRDPIGAIKEAYFDEEKQAIIATASLWEHYRPSTVQQMRKLYKDGDLHVSMEFKYPEGSLQANEDGTHTPTAGKFSGMGFVGQAGDPRSMVYLMAALEKDENSQQETVVADVIKEIGARLLGKTTEEEPEFDEQKQNDLNAELSAAHEGSFEWTARRLQEHLSAGRDVDNPAYHYVIATHPNHAIYQDGEDYFRINFKRSGDKLDFGEPQKVNPVYQETAKASAEASGEQPADETGNPSQGDKDTMTVTPEEALAAAKTENDALKAAFDQMKLSFDEMKAGIDAREASDKEKALADTRFAELDKIAPVKEEVKAALYESLKKLDDAGYEAVKSAFAAIPDEAKAGIDPTPVIANPDEPTGKPKNEQDVPKAKLDAFAEEAKAQFGAQKSEGE